MIVALPMRRAILVAIALLSLCAMLTAAAPVTEIKCYTRPSKEAKPAFSGPGLIQEVTVREGDSVKAGATLMVQDGDIDRMELRRLELEANSTARVEAAEAQLLVKRSTLKRKESAGPGVYPDAEVEEARADVTLGEKQVIVANEERQQNMIKLEAQQKKIEKLSLKAPIDGIVRKVVAQLGEWADPQSREGAIYIVKIDPLDVELILPIYQAKLLSIGEKLEVKFPKESSWLNAEIYFFDPVAEGGTEMLRVKAKLVNPELRPAGQAVMVKLPKKLLDAAAAAQQNARTGN